MADRWWRPRTSAKRRWWRRQVRVKVRTVRDVIADHYVEHSKRCTAALRAEISEHQPHVAGTPGIGDYGDRFFCSTCRTPWPCRFLRWAVPLTEGELAPIWHSTNRTDGRLPAPSAAAVSGSREAGGQGE